MIVFSDYQLLYLEKLVRADVKKRERVLSTFEPKAHHTPESARRFQAVLQERLLRAQETADLLAVAQAPRAARPGLKRRHWSARYATQTLAGIRATLRNLVVGGAAGETAPILVQVADQADELAAHVRDFFPTSRRRPT